MDRRERMNDLTVAQRAAMRGFQATIWTALPGIVQSFDAATMTATVQPAIKAQQRSPKGQWSDVTLPLLLDVPVIFPAGGGFALTFPIKKDDEGIVVFASRCIDSWWQSGGVQTQAELRMHDLSDGMFIPGLFSQPRKIENVSADKVQLRTGDGSAFFEMAADGTIKFKGNVSVEGNFDATGAVIAGKGGADQVSLQTHKHPANNAPPTPGT